MEKHNTFRAKEIKIIDFFSQEKIPYYIPIYQRNYNWTFENEVTQLLDDLEEFSDKSKDNSIYYLGNVIVKHNNQSGNFHDSKYELIDGQQRITTMLIIVKVLYDLINVIDWKDDNEKTLKTNQLKELLFLNYYNDEIISLKIHNPDSEVILEKLFLLEDWEEVDEQLEKSRYYKNYISIKNRLSIKDFKTWNDWYQKLSKIKFVRVSLGDDDDEISIFESINSKGLPLNILDMIRNYLFLLSEREKRKNKGVSLDLQINNIFTKKLEPIFLKKNNEKDLKMMNRFFSAHIANETFEDVGKEKLILYKKYKEMINSKMSDTKYSLKDILNSLTIDFEEYKRLNILSKKLEVELGNNINSSEAFLANSKLELYLPLFLCLNRMKKNGKLSDEDKSKIIELLDIHNILLSISNKKNKDNRFIFKYMKDVKGNITYNSLLNYLKKDNNNSKLISLFELRNGIMNTKIYFEDNKMTRYILYRMENYYKAKEKEDGITFKYSIEHIFPQNDKEWKQSFDSEELKERYLHTLGNLTLLKSVKNSSLSDSSWEIKKKSYKKSLEINKKIASNHEEWTIKKSNNSVIDRANRIIDEMGKIWPLSILPEKNMVNLEEEMKLNILINQGKISIHKGIEIVLFLANDFLTNNEIVSGLKDLYQLAENNGIDGNITFNKGSISNSGWLTQPLDAHKSGNEGKKRFREAIFVKNKENKWGLTKEAIEKNDKKYN